MKTTIDHIIEQDIFSPEKKLSSDFSSRVMERIAQLNDIKSFRFVIPWYFKPLIAAVLIINILIVGYTLFDQSLSTEQQVAETLQQEYGLSNNNNLYLSDLIDENYESSDN